MGPGFNLGYFQVKSPPYLGTFQVDRFGDISEKNFGKFFNTFRDFENVS